MNRIADYTLVRSLGDGNHGEFYLAERPDRLDVDAEFLAVKVWGAGASEAGFRKAIRELKLFASVKSPYLVTLFDAGQEGSTFYYSMEYFPLGSLASPSRPLSRAEVLRATAHAARAAHDLHEAGLVHREIKPANILLVEHGAKLSDLGLAQFMAPGMTVTGMGPIGSIEYVDPGLLRNERPSRASDIWSLGVTLHRVLAGVGVYGELPDHDPLYVVRTILNRPPTLAESLSADEQAVIRDCLAPDPMDRPKTAALVAERIEGLDDA